MVADRIKELEASLQFAEGGARVDALNELAQELKGSDYQCGLALSEEAYELAQGMSDVRRQASSLLNIGLFHIFLSQHEQARSQLLKALPLLRKIGDKRSEVRVLGNLGVSYYEQGQYTDALAYNLKALTLVQETGDKRLEIKCLNNIGLDYAKLGDYSTAMEYYAKALQLVDDFGDRQSQVALIINVGLVYQELGQYDKALAYHRESLTLSKGVGDKWAEAHSLCHLGRDGYLMGRYPEALETYQEALQYARDIGDQKNEADAIGGLGLCYSALQQYQDALEMHQEMLALTQAVGDQQGKGTALYHLGNTYLTLKDPQNARENLEQALLIAAATGAKKLVYQIHQAISETYELAGDLAQALHYYKMFYATEKDVYNQEIARKTKGLLVQHEVEKTQKEAEIHRLKNVELAQANEALVQADRQKGALLHRLQEQAEVLERLVKEDPLTGLYNRRFCDEQLAYEFARAQRFGHKLSVVFSDIDNFKAVNDSFSHQLGDEVLKIVAKLIVAHCRDIDTVARYGGEEFVLLLPESSADEAAMVCERIRRAVESFDWAQVNPDLQVTISLGISAGLAVKNAAEMLAAADASLYKAKQNGKNQARY